MWAGQLLNVPVIDHWWQTESGWPIAANPRGLGLFEIKSGAAGKAVPGFDIQILNSQHQPMAAGEMGDIAIKLPLPPGCMQTLWNDRERFQSAYLEKHPGWYCSGDMGYLDAEGYLYVMGRIDDVINVAGHRLSTGAMEEVLAAHTAVAECAVVGMNDELKGQLPLGFAVLKQDCKQDPAQVSEELIAQLRQQIGAVACLRQVLIVSRLPKTRSGKILRATLRAMLNAEPYKVPPTIDDPQILVEIEPQVLAVRQAIRAA